MGVPKGTGKSRSFDRHERGVGFAFSLSLRKVPERHGRLRSDRERDVAQTTRVTFFYQTTRELMVHEFGRSCKYKSGGKRDLSAPWLSCGALENDRQQIVSLDAARLSSVFVVRAASRLGCSARRLGSAQQRGQLEAARWLGCSTQRRLGSRNQDFFCLRPCLCAEVGLRQCVCAPFGAIPPSMNPLVLPFRPTPS